MRTDVPPDFLRVVDAIGLDQQLDEIFVFAPAGEIVRNVGARKFVEHLAAIGFQSGIHPQPERRIGRERQNVRQKIARMIHQLDGGLAIFHADVNVQAENQVGARHQLHILNDVLVTLVGMISCTRQSAKGWVAAEASRSPFSLASAIMSRRSFLPLPWRL